MHLQQVGSRDGPSKALSQLEDKLDTQLELHSTFHPIMVYLGIMDKLVFPHSHHRIR